MYRKALRTVKLTRTNSGAKPLVIAKPHTQLHKQMYKLNLKNKAINILGLEYPIEAGKHAEKFRSWNPKETTVRLKREIWVNVIFEKLVKEIRPKAVMGVDLNLKNLAITVLDLKGNLYIKRSFLLKA